MAGTVIDFAARLRGMDTVSRYPMTFFLEAVQADDLFTKTCDAGKLQSEDNEKQKANDFSHAPKYHHMAS